MVDKSKVIMRKINQGEFEKLKDLFPDSDDKWIKYRKMRLEQFAQKEIDVYVIELDSNFIGELSVNYSSHTLETETIPNKRVYLEAFRLDDRYQGLGLGQELVQFTLNDLENRGYSEFTIGVEDDNEVAKHIYFKYGFKDAIDKGYGNEFDPSEYTLYLRKSREKIK